MKEITIKLDLMSIFSEVEEFGVMKMWKCKECKTEIIEDYRQMTDEQGNFAGDMFVGFVCPKCLNFGIVEEHIAYWEEEDERD